MTIYDELKVTTAKPLTTCGHLRAGVSGAMKNLITLVVMALFALPSLTKADVEDRLYDFTDAYYLENGVNPALISGRMQAGTGIAVNDTPIFPFQRNVRALLTLPAYDHSGDINYFTVLGGISANAFTANAAGRASASRLPIASRSICSRRQALIRLASPSASHRCSICAMVTSGLIRSVSGFISG